MDDRQRKDVENCISSILTSNPIRMTVQDLNKDFRNMVGYPVPYRKLGFNQLDDYLRSIPHRVQVIGSGYFAEVRVIVSNKTAHINDLICKQKVNRNPRASRNGLRKHVTPHMQTHQFYRSRSTEYSKPQQASPSAPQTSTPNRAPQTSTLARAQTSTPKAASPVADKKMSSDDDTTLVPFVVRKRLRELVLEYPGGILCSRIPELYRQRFNQMFDYCTYGYRSVAQLCLDMPLTFKYQHCRNGDVRIFDSSITLPESPVEPATSTPTTKVKISEKKNTEPALPDNVEDILLSYHQEKMPENAILVDNIGRQWIGPEVAVLDFVDMYVADVYDPSKFWIHLKEYTDELDELMDDMQEFYQEHKTRYEVPFYALKKDMYIACMFSKEYHRAKIIDTSKKMQSLLKVFFIDYGTFATVFTTGILYLNKSFVELPAQAIRARLHGIQPIVKDEFWPREASIRFLNLVKRKENLVAQIMWIDNVEHTLDIVLADTSVPDEDFYVNDALVAEGFAKFLDEAQDDPKPKDYTPSVQCIHLFPTHEELENGSAPNLYLMVLFDQSNVSIASILPQYFNKIADTALSNITDDFDNVEEDSCNQNGENSKELSWNDKIEELEKAGSTCSTSPITEEDNTATAEIITPTTENSEAESSRPKTPVRPPPGFHAVPPPYQAHSLPGFNQQIDPRLLMLCINNAQYSNFMLQNRYPPVQYNPPPFNYYNLHPGMYPNPISHFYNASLPCFNPQYIPPNHSFFHNQYNNQSRNVGNFFPPQNFPTNQNIYSSQSSVTIPKPEDQKPDNFASQQNFPHPQNLNVPLQCYKESSVTKPDDQKTDMRNVCDRSNLTMDQNSTKPDDFSAKLNVPHPENQNADFEFHRESSVTFTKPNDQKTDMINVCDRSNLTVDQNSTKPDDFSAKLNVSHPEKQSADFEFHRESSVTFRKPDDRKTDMINVCDGSNLTVDQNSTKPDDFSAKLDVPHPENQNADFEFHRESSVTFTIPEDHKTDLVNLCDKSNPILEELEKTNLPDEEPVIPESPLIIECHENIDEEELPDNCSTGSYGCADNQHNDLVEVVSIGGLEYHILYFRNRRFLVIEELLQNLMGAVIPTSLIRRRFNTSPPFIDILNVSLSDKPELAIELLRYNLIKENGDSIDIVSVDDSEHVITVLKGTSDNRKCNAFLRNIKTVYV